MVFSKKVTHAILWSHLVTPDLLCICMLSACAQVLPMSRPTSPPLYQTWTACLTVLLNLQANPSPSPSYKPPSTEKSWAVHFSYHPMSCIVYWLVWRERYSVVVLETNVTTASDLGPIPHNHFWLKSEMTLWIRPLWLIPHNCFCIKNTNLDTFVLT